MSTPYLITFTPVNRFFFGSSHSFAEGFYVESLKYPQPTTMLGCLRNTILIQEGIVKDDGTGRHIPDIDNTDAKKLTGTSTINGLDDSNDDFGVIERVSPIFIVKHGNNGIEDILFPLPSDIEKDKDSNTLRCLNPSRESNAISSYSGNRKDYAILSSKNPKLPEVNCLGGKDFWSAYINNDPLPYNNNYDENSIFKTYISVGIGCENKDAGGGKRYFKKTTIKGMFYTKIDYSLDKGFSFGVLLWLKDNNVLKDDVVLLGGEQSAFHMKITPATNSIFTTHPVTMAIMNDNCDLFQKSAACANKDKLVALSPLAFDEDINSSLAGIMEHRIIKGIKAIRTIKKIGAVKSEAVRMIPAGSVLYPDKSINLTGWKIPYKVGYNHAIKIQRG